MERQPSSWEVGTPIESSAYYWEGEPYVLIGNERRPSSAPSVVDLFSGCGGFAEGFRLAGFESVLGVDIHLPAARTFTANHKQSSFVLGDIRKVEDAMFLECAGGRPVDVVTAGVPCQGFSLSNRKRWEHDERNFLFREFIRVLRLLAPKVAVLENVSGIRSSGGGKFAKGIVEAMESCGYCVDSRLLTASDYGVPQNRKRMFFVGVLGGEGFSWPNKTHGLTGIPKVSVDEAIGDLPSLASGESAFQYSQAPCGAYQVLMRAEATSDLLNHIAPKHHQDVVDKIAATLPGKPIYSRYPQRIRLDPDGQSPTQVSGGIRPQYQFGHPSQDRGLTVRERCRIQSFGDHYFIDGGVVQGRVQTGNAVPPLLAKALALSVRGISST